jgi:hypothetical protein
MKSRRTIQAIIVAGVVAASVLVIASPASAYTTKQSAWYNDMVVAKVWFNSGTHAPSLGRNSFTLKIENEPGTTRASVYWQIGSSGDFITIYGPGAERTWSVSGPVEPDRVIWYEICATHRGKSVCGPRTYDYVR